MTWNYTADPLEKVSLTLPISLRDRIDKARKDKARTAWIKDACLEKIERDSA